MLLAWISEPLFKPQGLPGPAGRAGLLTDVSYTKSRQDANFDSRFWQGYQKIISQLIHGKNKNRKPLIEPLIFKSLTPTFLSSSPTMLSADILADVVRGVPVRPSPKTKQIQVGEHIIC